MNINKNRLHICNLTKRFAERSVLQSISLQIAANEIVAIQGPSGCGKSTLLRVIAGLEPADDGDVLVDGKSVLTIDPFYRQVAMIFQSAVEVFPWATVEQNIVPALQKRRRTITDTQPLRAAVLEVMEWARLPVAKLTQRAGTLSGGEKQRLSLARVLAERPLVLLADEPLANLDPQLKSQLVEEMRSFFKQQNMTVLYVTHDQAEAEAIADRVVTIHDL